MKYPMKTTQHKHGGKHCKSTRKPREKEILSNDRVRSGASQTDGPVRRLPEVFKGWPLDGDLARSIGESVAALTEIDTFNASVLGSAKEIRNRVANRENSVHRVETGCLKGPPLVGDLMRPRIECVGALADRDALNANVTGSGEEICYTAAHREHSVYGFEAGLRKGWPSGGDWRRSSGEFVSVLTGLDAVNASVIRSPEEICCPTAHVEHGIHAVEAGCLKGWPTVGDRSRPSSDEVTRLADLDVVNANVLGSIEEISLARLNGEARSFAHGFVGVDEDVRTKRFEIRRKV